MLIAFSIISGLIIGSFLNVVIYRLPRRESVVGPGSRCPVCGHNLGAGDLIPVLSYIRQQGKCRYCRAGISSRYPLTEIITAAAFLSIWLQWGLSWEGLAGVILTSLLIPAAGIDLEYGIIPDRLTIPGIIIGLLFAPLTVGFISSLAGALLFGGVLFLAALISRGGMGGGDIKLAAAIGAFTGWQGAVLAFILSSLLGGMGGLILLLSRKADRKTAVKLGPFLALGGWTAYMWGTTMIDFYLNLLQG
jgi:leader peptidase (prepilin peptidase)/N-methyltransferase